MITSCSFTVDKCVFPVSSCRSVQLLMRHEYAVVVSSLAMQQFAAGAAIGQQSVVLQAHERERAPPPEPPIGWSFIQAFGTNKRVTNTQLSSKGKFPDLPSGK